jgi:hypothetical protein
MAFNDIVATAFNGAFAKINATTARLRRNAILYFVGAFCAVAAIVLAVSASLLALEPRVGEVYARLILAGMFTFVVVAVVFALWLASRRHATVATQGVPLHAQAQTAQRSAQFAQLAMIVEAVLLGYSMARRR